MQEIGQKVTVLSTGSGGQVGETSLHGDAASGAILFSIAVKTDGGAVGSVGLVRASNVRKIKSGVFVEGDSNMIAGVEVVGASSIAEVGPDFRWQTKLTCDDTNDKCACPATWSSPLWPVGSSNLNNEVSLQLVGFEGMLAAMASLEVNGARDCTIDDCPDVGETLSTKQFRDSSGLDICRDATLPCNSESSYEARELSATKDRICKPLSPPCDANPQQACESDACFESTPPSAVNDRVCTAMTPPCPHSFYESTAPTETSDRECTKLSPECWPEAYEAQKPSYAQDRACLPISSECPDGHFQTSEATPISDRVCMPVSDPCVLNVTYESVPPSWNVDRRCTPVSAPCHEQDGTWYEAAPPQLAADRVCNTVTECTPDETYEEAAPTTTSDRVCPDLKVCVVDSEYEQSAPTATANRQCSPITDCIRGTYEHTVATATSDTVCVVWKLCSSGFYETGTPSVLADRVCSPCFSSDFGELEEAALESGECVDFLNDGSAQPENNKSGAAIAASVTVAVLVLVGLGAFIYVRKRHAAEAEDYFKPAVARLSESNFTLNPHSTMKNTPTAPFSPNGRPKTPGQLASSELSGTGPSARVSSGPSTTTLWEDPYSDPVDTVTSPPVPKRSVRVAGKAGAAGKAKAARPSAADRQQLLAAAKTATLQVRAEKSAPGDFGDEPELMYLEPTPVAQKKKKKKKANAKAKTAAIPTAKPEYSSIDVTKKKKNQQKKKLAAAGAPSNAPAQPKKKKKAASNDSGHMLDSKGVDDDDYNLNPVGGDGYLQVEEGTMPKGQTLQKWEADTGVYDIQTTVEHKGSAAVTADDDYNLNF